MKRANRKQAAGGDSWMSNASRIARWRSIGKKPRHHPAAVRTSDRTTARVRLRNVMARFHRPADVYQACLITSLLIANPASGAFAQEISIAPARMTRLGTVDER